MAGKQLDLLAIWLLLFIKLHVYWSNFGEEPLLKCRFFFLWLFWDFLLIFVNFFFDFIGWAWLVGILWLQSWLTGIFIQWLMVLLRLELKLLLFLDLILRYMAWFLLLLTSLLLGLRMLDGLMTALILVFGSFQALTFIIIPLEGGLDIEALKLDS